MKVENTKEVGMYTLQQVNGDSNE